MVTSPRTSRRFLFISAVHFFFRSRFAALSSPGGPGGHGSIPNIKSSMISADAPGPHHFFGSEYRTTGERVGDSVPMALSQARHHVDEADQLQ